jgi:hypothetical protein
MKKQIKHLLVALALPALLSTLNPQLSTAFAQGSLIPPPGPPGPTMLTLSQLADPRTPISSLPYAITNPGSYYVTTNLTGGASGDGIDIDTNDVTLDLNGFTLRGVSGSGNGINVPNPQNNLVIRNGVVDFWGQTGVNTANGNNSQLERLRMSSNGNGAFSVGNRCTVKDCTANGNGGLPDQVGNDCTIIACTASGNNCFSSDPVISVGNNCIVKDCNLSDNIGYQNSGIIVGNNCIVKDCNLSGNQNKGIEVVGNNCLIAGNNCIGNAIDGIFINGTQNRIDGNNLGNNGSYGIIVYSPNVGNIIIRNSAPGNGTSGYATVTGNNDYGPTNYPPSQATSPWANF